MKNTKPKMKSLNIKNTLTQHGRILFCIVAVLAYTFLITKMIIYKNQTVSLTPSDTRALNINKDTVDKLNSLKDNSVQVQAIFDDARNNPFQ